MKNTVRWQTHREVLIGFNKTQKSLARNDRFNGNVKRSENCIETKVMRVREVEKNVDEKQKVMKNRYI